MQRQLNDRVTVCGQIDPAMIAAIAQSGFSAIVDGRPDREVPASHSSVMMREQAESQGIAFHYIPMTPGELPSEQDAADFLGVMQSATIFAYCGGGPRVIVLASFAAAADGQQVGQIIADARKAGMDLMPLKTLLVERGATAD